MQLFSLSSQPEPGDTRELKPRQSHEETFGFVVANFAGQKIHRNFASNGAGIVGQHEVLHGWMTISAFAGEQEAECCQIIRQVLLLDPAKWQQLELRLRGSAVCLQARRDRDSQSCPPGTERPGNRQEH